MKKHCCKMNFWVGSFLTLIPLLAILLGVNGPLYPIDIHEHLTGKRAEIFLTANASAGISQTVLIPSAEESLTLNGKKSFTKYRENTEVIFKLAKKYPSNFIPFCTVSPLDNDALDYLKGCIQSGGKGVKLYNGHPYYHQVFGMPLDSPRMSPIYAYIESNQIPVLYHININHYEQELRRVLDKFSQMMVAVPSYMLSSANIQRVSALLDAYPNLFIDISFGAPEYMAAGFRRVDLDPKKYSTFMNTHTSRILFGTDAILGSKQTDEKRLAEIFRCYKDLLSEEVFSCKLVQEYYAAQLKNAEDALKTCKKGRCISAQENYKAAQERVENTIELSGLDLSRSVLRQIYEKNPRRFLRADQ